MRFSRSALEVPRIVVLTKDSLQYLYLLAHAGVGAAGLEEAWHELVARLRGLAQCLERLAPATGVARLPRLLKPRVLLSLDLRVDLERRDVRPIAFRCVLVDPDDHLLAFLDLLLEVEGGLGDLALRIAALDGFDHPAHPLDLSQVSLESLLHATRQCLEVVAAGERVNGVRDAGLVSDELLGPERKGHRLFRRQRVGLVERVRVQRLGPAKHRGERLQRDANDVVVRLLRGERDARGLRVRPQHERALVRRVIAPLDLARPDPPRRAELRDLLEEVVVHVEEEREVRDEVVWVEARCDAPFHVLEAVDERKGQLLERRGTGFADVVTGDRDRVPPRNVARAVTESVDDETHRGLHRHDPLALRYVLLESVVLDRAAEPIERDPALLG